MSAHSIVSPSSFSRTLACPASLLAGIWHPKTSSQAADRGTMIHERAECIIKAGVQCEGTPFEFIKSSDPEIGFYVDHCLALAKESLEYGVEERVDFSYLANHRLDCFGTVDFWAYLAGELHIVDFKSGQQPVSPFNNAQLTLYALGVMQVLMDRCPDMEIRAIRLCIAQAGKIQTEVIDLNELNERERQYWETLRMAFNPKARYAAEVGSHCQWCPAKVSCPTVERSLTAALGVSKPEMAEVEQKTLVEIMRMSSIASAVYDDAKDLLQRHFELTGELADGLKTKAYTPPRKWNPDIDITNAIFDLCGDEAFAAGVLLPASPATVLKVCPELGYAVVSGDKRLIVGLE